MPEITDPLITEFANERGRTEADHVVALKYQIDAWVSEWAAKGMSAAITAAGATNLISDRSAEDGRVRITGTQLVNMRAALLQLQTAINTTLVSGVGASVFDILNAIQVNGSPR